MVETQPFLQWRDISTGPDRHIECSWTGSDDRRRLTVVWFERGCVMQTLIGPELDDIAAQTIRFEVDRFDLGLPCLYHSEDAFETALQTALAKLHAQLGAA